MTNRRIPASNIFILVLSFFLLVLLFGAGCDSSEDSDDSDNDEIGDDDSINVNDDTSDDELNDDIDDDIDDPTYLTPPFVRPDLSINAYHMATTHNTFIWRGFQGILSRVSSMAVIEALDKNQRFLELDFDGPTQDGDFICNHGPTQTVRLSSVLRNIRWWSDTHPNHEMIVIGGNWGIDNGDEGHAALRSLFDEFFASPSPLHDNSPLFSLQDWLNDMTQNLEPTMRAEIQTLNPIQVAQVLGYPSIRELRGKIMLEAGGTTFDQLPCFFRIGGDGHTENHDENYLENIDQITRVRIDQRLSRIYTSGFRLYSGNFDIFEGFAAGVTNNALNMEWTGENSPSVYSFADEFAPGFASAGFVQSFDDAPTRLGPAVFVTAFSADAPATRKIRLRFETPLTESPIRVFNILLQGLSGQTDAQILVGDANATLLYEHNSSSRRQFWAVSSESDEIELEILVNGDAIGYEAYVYGPAIGNAEVFSSRDVVESKDDSKETIWISPTFTPMNLAPTGRCTALIEGGRRVYGAWDGETCDASENPSFMIEMSF